MTIAAFTTALAGIKAATDAAKGLLAVNSTYSAAEFKLKAADLMSALADARIALAEAQDVAASLQSEIEQLKASFEAKGKVIKAGSAYYEVRADGEASGDPYCMRCWEEDHKLRHLAYGERLMDKNVCPSCKTGYGREDTYRHE